MPRPNNRTSKSERAVHFKNKQTNRRHRLEHHESLGIGSPEEVSSLVAWYDFSDPTSLFLDATRLVPVTADADPILGVTDKSAATNDLTGLVTAGPLFKVNIQNGNSIARFDGTNDVLGPAANPNSNAGGGTLFYVQRLVSESASYGSPWGQAGSDTLSDHHCHSDSSIYDGFGSTARKTVGNPSPSLTSFYIFGCVSAASDYRAYVAGGTALFSTETNTVGWGTAPRMGQGVLAYSNTDIAEVLLYDAPLSLANLNSVGFYLASKWGISWTTAV